MTVEVRVRKCIARRSLDSTLVSMDLALIHAFTQTVTQSVGVYRVSARAMQTVHQRFVEWIGNSFVL